MPGLVPGIHVFLLQGIKRWMVGTSPGHDGNDRSPTLVESHLMDSLEIPAGSAAPALTSVIHSQPPRIWKFWGTALWGLFIFAAMFVGQIGVVAWFILRRGGPIDIAAAVHVVGGGLTISLSVIMGLPAVLAALWIAIRFSHTPFADYLALRRPSWIDLAIGVVALIVLVMGWDLLSRAAGREIAPGFMGEVLNSARADGSLWLLVIAFVVAAPISEEFFVRGFLYHGWSEGFLGTQFTQVRQPIKRALQDEDRGVFVDHLRAPGTAHVHADQFAFDGRGGKPLVPQAKREIGEFREIAGEGA